MHDYISLADALEGLKKRGYVEDFNLKENCLECRARQLDIEVADFEVDEVYRFEGDSNPDDSSVLYAISSGKHGIKGVLVDAYGAYASELSADMIEKLRYRPGQ